MWLQFSKFDWHQQLHSPLWDIIFIIVYWMTKVGGGLRPEYDAKLPN